MMRDGLRGLVLVFAATLAALVLGAALAGCAAPRAAARATSPCVTTLPTRAKFQTLSEPERVAYLDGEGGEAKVGIRITVDAASASAFFNYVESLEALARRALGCVAR